MAEAPMGIGYGGVCVCVYSSPFTSKWPILIPHGYILRVSTKQGEPSKIFIGKVLICERKRPSNLQGKSRSLLDAVLPFSGLVFGLSFS